MKDIQDLLQHFPGAKLQGDEYIAPCPMPGCHNHTPKLHIKPDGDTVKIHCVKCNANGVSVMEALGLPARFLYLDQPGTGEVYHAPAQSPTQPKFCNTIPARAKIKKDTWGQLQRTHQYRDSSGNVVFIKAIYKKDGISEKTCRWYTPHEGGFICGTGGALVPLYNADKLHNSTAHTVYVVEGEKDCDTMEKMGLLAVSMPNGGGQTKWDASYGEALRCRDVVIITDNDDVGEKYGKTVASHLDGVAGSIKIIPAEAIYPSICSKGDITDIYDILGKEATACRLQEAEANQKHAANDILFQLGAYTMDELTPEDMQPPEFVVDGMIPVGMTFLSGAPKTRKSFLALQMAEAVATGSDFLGHHTHPCSVLYFDLEGNKNRLAARTRSMGIHLPSTVYVLNEVDAKLAGTDDKDLVRLIREIHRRRPEIKLVIIDTYSRARGTVKCNGSNAYDQDVQFLEPVQRMAQAEKIALVFVHHDRKGASMAGDSLERLSGTMGISGSADSVLTLVSEGKRFEGKATLEYNPRDAQGGQMDLIFDDLTTKWEPFTSPPDSIENSPIAKYFRDNPPPTGAQGIHMSYSDIVAKAYPGTQIDNPAKIVGDGLKPYILELYSKFGIGFQMSVKVHGERGLRVYCSKCPLCPPF